MTVGSIIVVQPGEKVPLDGVVTEGSSTLNTAALTGESLPVMPPPATRSSAAASNGRAGRSAPPRPSVNLPSPKFWSWWRTPAPTNPAPRTSSPNLPASTPPVCIGALVLAVLPAGGAAGHGPQRRLGHLGLPCPDLPGHQLPLCWSSASLRSFFAGLGGASRAGVLVKAPTIWRPSPKPVW